MEMNQPVGATPLDARPDGLVGKPVDRYEGRLKVTGRAPYAYEVREPRDPAYGFIVGAGVASGRIRAMQVGAARRAPGVLYVINPVGPEGDQTVGKLTHIRPRQHGPHGHPQPIRQLTRLAAQLQRNVVEGPLLLLRENPDLALSVRFDHLYPSV